MKKLFIVVIVSLFVVGCKKEFNPETSSQITHKSMQSSMPFATEDELAKFDSDDEIIHYKVARYLAYDEIEAYLNEPLELEPNEYRLTEFPVIIWDYDSRPKHYEFGVIKGEQIVSTITTLAKKEGTTAVSFVFPEALNYEVRLSGYKPFVGNYPSVYYGQPSSPGQAPSVLIDADKETQINTIPSCNILENYANLINSMDDESRDNHVTTLTDLQKEIEESRIGLTDFWQEVDSRKAEILDMTDNEILTQIHVNPIQKASITWNDYIIPRYNNNLKLTRWNGWCGTSALAWVYRGLYPNYPKNSSNYLRIRGDGSFNYFL